MGFFSTSPKKQQPTMIKIAAVVCLAALASADADADAYYNTYGYGLNHGLGYTNAYTAGYGINAYAAPLRYSGAYGYAAPAAAAAIPVRGYGTPATVGSNLPYGYAASGRYVADSVGAVHIAKREAEAEPEADADAYYSTYGYNNYGYSGLGYSGLGYSAIARPAVVSSYAARPVVAASPVVAAVSSYAARPVIAAPAAYSTGYSAIATPAVYSSGYSTIARPVVSSYTARPIVSSYAARPIVSTRYGGYGINRFGLY